MRHLTLLKAIATRTHKYILSRSTMTYAPRCDASFELYGPLVFVIALGKEIEVICLLFEARGLETDQLDVLMFKFDSILTWQRAAGGWRNKNSILSVKEAAAFISSLPDIKYVVLLLILTDILMFSVL